MVNSRDKGKRGEYIFRDWLKKTFNDTEARRGQQRKGGEDSPDVDSPMLQMLGIHPEVKFTLECGMLTQGKITDWLHQAATDAGEKQGVVFHKWNRSGWFAIYTNDYGNTVIQWAEEFLDERLREYKEAQATLDRLNGLVGGSETIYDRLPSLSSTKDVP